MQWPDIETKTIKGFNFWLFLLSSNIHVLASADNTVLDTLIVTRISETIVIDGDVGDPVWSTIEPLSLVSYEPVAGLVPSERTEVRIAYDNKYIYASVKAYDSDPAGIRINSLYRDAWRGPIFSTSCWIHITIMNQQWYLLSILQV